MTLASSNAATVSLITVLVVMTGSLSGNGRRPLAAGVRLSDERRTLVDEWR
jgi:hypothetical protein